MTEQFQNTTAYRKRNVFDVIEHIEKEKAKNGVDNEQDNAKNILIRVDFNVPTTYDEATEQRTITDDSRIRAALPTIRAVIESKNNAILVSHMGRPKIVQKKGVDNDEEECLKEKEKLSLRVCAKRLSELLELKINFSLDCVGNVAKEAIATSLPKSEGGGVIVLENLRFRKDEENNEDEFARSLASLADAYINDAFGTCHRAHASVFGVTKFFPKELCGLGCLVMSELSFLDFGCMEEEGSVMAVIGGSKVSTKLPVIHGVLQQVDTLILGGGLAFTFLKAKGLLVGNSLVEDGMIDNAKDIMKTAKQLGKKIVLPVDAVCGREFPSGPVNSLDTKTFTLLEGEEHGVLDGWSGFDIGPKSVELFRRSLGGCNKLVVNGPMGVFERPPYDKGTRGLVNILEGLTKEGAVTVVGGGDSVAALEAFGKTDAASYISTGGGATLELMAGNELPGVTAISSV